LNVETLDFVHRSRGSASVGEELGDNGEFAIRVNGLAGTVKAGIAHAVGVEVTSVWVTCAGISVGRICATTSVPNAPVEGLQVSKPR
jgi:hypothetical protein